MNDENTDESLTPYHLIYSRNIATNKVSLLKMATDGESLRLNCKKINIVLNILQNDLLMFIFITRALYISYRENEEFLPRMKWRKGNIVKLIRGIDNQIYTKNS